MNCWSRLFPSPSKWHRMKAFLRAVAILLGVAIMLQLFLVLQIAASGHLTALARPGALGILTFVGWVIVLTAGPIAAVQLWRLRRSAFLLPHCCVESLAVITPWSWSFSSGPEHT